MGRLLSIQKNLPHLVIKTSDGIAHVVPRSVLERFASGRLPLSEIDDGEEILQAIIADWLRSSG